MDGSLRYAVTGSGGGRRLAGREAADQQRALELFDGRLTSRYLPLRGVPPRPGPAGGPRPRPDPAATRAAPNTHAALPAPMVRRALAQPRPSRSAHLNHHP